MDYKASERIQDLQYFGEFGGVNPSISDSSTYTFLSAKTMFDTFEGNTEGCYLYSRHSSPSNLYLGEAMAQLEGTESANVFASGMGAISAVILQLCNSGDHIVCSRTIYGGTYAFLKNFLKKFNISTSFVDITNLDVVENSINKNTKMIYCEAISNPLLEVADINALSSLSKKHKLPLVVDNTFSPLSVNAAQLGADIVVHSLTKFINGSSDCVAGAVCASSDFCLALKDVNDGAGMLMGSTLDSLRAASILKNMRTLHIRIKKHSENALYLAQQFEREGLKVAYPGLESHPGHETMKAQMNPEYGFGGLLTLDVGSLDKANALMEQMQQKKLGYLAVSLGFYKTLFSAPGTSTSSEIPMEEQEELGLSQGLIRFSIGLENDIHHTYLIMRECMEQLGILTNDSALV
ncbi:aminotransferase class I/II-fold pyridoxal phosphate-dependent enzyme [Muricauda sp. JGD-17]|uniref:Aminotransferase class I/II-fold pyridoxal phosphate-dependent enzyme n=1 Tax=Flagellimonas ochracea TaxID=2696472 RepID=A0A964WWP7_9FLAO|nr:aminotransferase class I/II-fold pyridoxal phosphate-dependent enzyme [Allomuricauda ochracea]NAY90804.1 aminotransferase class I/II-fold pyridoxal phosphate-dependent enzyme [Allomuricauda ochracea]